MNKSDLNNCMLFKMRCGDLCVLEDIEGNKVFCNKEDIKQGYSSNFVTLGDYDEELSSEGDDYDIVAIKQRTSCIGVISDVLNNQEPDEWDWEEKEEPKTKNTVQNITLNITIDQNTDINKIMTELDNNLKKYKFNCL